MKECSREEVLKGEKSQYDPPNQSRSSVGPGGQRDQEHGVVQYDQEEGYQQLIYFRSRNMEVPQSGNEVSQVQVPNGMNIFYEYDLIVHAIQGLYLLIASLVYYSKFP